MEAEITSFIVVWVVALSSFSYCHAIAKIIPKGLNRFLAILPTIFLFLYLPLNLSTLCLGGPTSFLLGWLGTFKLLLFAFGQGPLSSKTESLEFKSSENQIQRKKCSSSSNPPLSFLYFISLAALPIKIQPNKTYPSPQTTKKNQLHKTPIEYVIKTLLVATYTLVYDIREKLPQKAVFVCYCVYLYLALEFVLVIPASLARASFGVDMEPTFNEPYLATSLQDFWGRRWNLMVTSILRPTVYHPTKSISSCLIGRKWATLPSVFAVFLVSGIMHELIFYYIGRKTPTWDLTCFFVVHGICLLVEIAVKKWLDGRFRLPTAVSRPLTLAFVVATASWMFVPELLRCEADVKARREIAAIMNFLQQFVENLGFRSIGMWGV